MPDFSFPRHLRIRHDKDFQRVFDLRVSASDDVIVVFGCNNGLPYSRLGISVPRKIRKAVKKNRWKRLIREAFRLTRHNLPQGYDFIVVPRPDAEPELKRLQESLQKLTQRVVRKWQRVQSAPRVEKQSEPSTKEAAKPRDPN